LGKGVVGKPHREGIVVESLWDEREAAQYAGDLAQRVHTSRLLGREPALVLHGGRNTSVKVVERSLLGQEREVLYVKGSGSDLATIRPEDFAPVLRQPLLELARLPALSDPQMAKELRGALTDPAAPDPSVEAILHALLPFQFVDHTHADAIIALTNAPDGRRHVEEAFGDTVVVIPYVMPGFELSRRCAEIFPNAAGQRTIGMILMQHGIFSFGETARESYERMIALVSRAEAYLARRGAWQIPVPDPPVPQETRWREEIASMRQAASEAAGFPLLLGTCRDPLSLAFVRREDVVALSQQGPATPDHVMRTKRLPLVGRDVRSYQEEYERYFEENAGRCDTPRTMLDPAPRIILDPEWGLCSLGRSMREVTIGREIYQHTLEIILRATALGGYRALPAADIFAVEYWDLEQAKQRRRGAPPPFAGEIALITGAASGIGAACVQAFLAQGAAVVGLDIRPEIDRLNENDAFLGLVCDITRAPSVEQALEQAAQTFGGIDMAVLNAGILPPSRPIAATDPEVWRRTMSVNLDANAGLLKELHPLLKRAPQGGRVVIIGSKNVPAPGPGLAAYSASKAALTQLGRVAALEWSQDRIRVNMIHPNAVFDTGLWTEEALQERASAYGLSVAQYKTNNLLQTEVASRDVAAMACAMCGPLFARTTGAQVPIDGGNERVV
jgi:rhamnose utilization protein RhaD (predicted bifunctional aldolase and dehydrogenase)/NAD(P)-dependent dehydrogenase (short-subunit alcohol dehydrogenase family)